VYKILQQKNFVVLLVKFKITTVKNERYNCKKGMITIVKKMIELIPGEVETLPAKREVTSALRDHFPHSEITFKKLFLLLLGLNNNKTYCAVDVGTFYILQTCCS
jgi:hypothetical protein